MASKLPFLACLASTLFMTGLIWFVHIVHYPLFARVGGESFRSYHDAHSRTTTYVVVVPMVVELITGAWLVARRPDGVAPWLVWLGLAAAVVSWASTFLLSIPSHGRLASGFDAEVHRALVRTNAVRLASWTTHAAVLLAMTARMIR